MTEQKKTRSVSEETQLRLLLKKLTDHVLELKETQRTTNLLIAGRFDDLELEVKKLGRSGTEHKRELKAVAMLAGDTFKKTVELHAKLIGSANGLGKRLYDLEQARTQRSSRPPRRG